MDVGDLAAQQLAAPGPGVRGRADERVDPGVRGLLLDVRQELPDLLPAQVVLTVFLSLRPPQRRQILNRPEVGCSSNHATESSLACAIVGPGPGPGPAT